MNEHRIVFSHIEKFLRPLFEPRVYDFQWATTFNRNTESFEIPTQEIFTICTHDCNCLYVMIRLLYSRSALAFIHSLSVNYRLTQRRAQKQFSFFDSFCWWLSLTHETPNGNRTLCSQLFLYTLRRAANRKAREPNDEITHGLRVIFVFCLMNHFVTTDHNKSKVSRENPYSTL